MKTKKTDLKFVKKPEDMRTANVHATAWKSQEGIACARAYADLATAAEIERLAKWMDKVRAWQAYNAKLLEVSDVR
ncbi:MAG: hypothetical protein EBR07_09975 [Planctomycetes bacterium]|nr:hypothetical protein [Planctomycetota bacterium]